MRPVPDGADELLDHVLQGDDADGPAVVVGDGGQVPAEAAQADEGEVESHTVAGLVVTGDGPLVVREKEFEAEPLTLAQALDEMELVGHDFFLYKDADTGRPSVVYRRKAYNYGVIHLNVS